MIDKNYAQKSRDVDNKTKQKLIEQSTFVQEIAPLYLEYNAIPLNGNGLISTFFNSNIKNAKEIIFSSADSIRESLNSTKKVGVLISCSHRRAGGGWLSGSLAQEESVSRSSTWAVQAGLTEFNSWYSHDKKIHWLGQKGTLVIDGLLIFDENGLELSEPKHVVFAGIAAANKAALANDSYWNSEKGIAQRQEQLIESLACAFSALHQKGVEDIILCAFGTNIFGWELEESIKCLYEATKLSPANLNFICALCNDQKSQLGKEIYINLLNEEKLNKSVKKITKNAKI